MTAVYLCCAFACYVAGTIGASESEADDQHLFVLIFGRLFHPQSMDELTGELVPSSDVRPDQFPMDAGGENEPIE
jgi:hypothetical protein